MEILTRIKHPWVVAVGSLVAYAAGFPALYPVIGDVYGSLSFIPVALAAHLYGRIGGYGFVVLTSVLNGALFSAAALESGNEAAVWEAIVPVLVLLATAEFVAQLRSANRALRESNRSKDYFLASVSHELRTPLTGVVGFADTLTAAWEDMSDEDKLALMSDIDSQAKEMASIIDDLLVASRAELDQLTVLRQPVDVSAEIQAVLASLPGVQDRTVLFIEKDGVMAVGDAARVRQIVRNLTTNALRYGGSTIWLGADTVDTTVQIRV
ncbi:MAG: sensor histidine kinase, partial [Actinomycetota bacterium]